MKLAVLEDIERRIAGVEEMIGRDLRTRKEATRADGPAPCDTVPS
jgi:hypothetical protein